MRTAFTGAAFAAATLILAPDAATAAFLRVELREDKILPPAPDVPLDVRVINMYTVFDGPGEASGPNRVNSVARAGQLAAFGLHLFGSGNFFQAALSEGASGSNAGAPDVAEGSARALYDSFVTIGRKTQDSNIAVFDFTTPDASAPMSFGFANTDGVAGDPMLGLGSGHDAVFGAWMLPVANRSQGFATLNPGNGQFETPLGQFGVSGFADAALTLPGGGNNITLSEIFDGWIFLERYGDVSAGEQPLVSVGSWLFLGVPAPGTAALLAFVCVPALRRRRG